MAQEALNNARKHAQTDRIRLTLLESRGTPSERPQITLEVRDWGQGFVLEEKISDYVHLGIQGMIERVSLMDGTHSVYSAPGEGTTIRAVFPTLESQEEERRGEPA